MIRMLKVLIPTLAFGMALAAQNVEPATSPSHISLAPDSTSREGLRFQIPDLAAHPLRADGLEFLIQKFNGPLLGSGGGLLWISLRIENKSTEFKPFALEHMIALGNDKTQAFLALSSPIDRPLYQSLKTRIAPGAHLTLACQLSAPIVLPIRFYYDDQLLVEVVKSDR